MLISLLGLLAWQNPAGAPSSLDGAAAGFTGSAPQAEQRGDRRGQVEALTGSGPHPGPDGPGRFGARDLRLLSACRPAAGPLVKAERGDRAAFTLVDDLGVTVSLQKPPNRWPLYLVLLALALGGAGVGLHRRRAKLRG